MSEVLSRQESAASVSVHEVCSEAGSTHLAQCDPALTWCFCFVFGARRRLHACLQATLPRCNSLTVNPKLVASSSAAEKAAAKAAKAKDAAEPAPADATPEADVRRSPRKRARVDYRAAEEKYSKIKLGAEDEPEESEHEGDEDDGEHDDQESDAESDAKEPDEDKEADEEDADDDEERPRKKSRKE